VAARVGIGVGVEFGGVAVEVAAAASGASGASGVPLGATATIAAPESTLPASVTLALCDARFATTRAGSTAIATMSAVASASARHDAASSRRSPPFIETTTRQESPVCVTSARAVPDACDPDSKRCTSSRTESSSGHPTGAVQWSVMSVARGCSVCAAAASATLAAHAPKPQAAAIARVARIARIARIGAS
jgi:hypothetical protein